MQEELHQFCVIMKNGSCWYATARDAGEAVSMFEKIYAEYLSDDAFKIDEVYDMSIGKTVVKRSDDS